MHAARGGGTTGRLTRINKVTSKIIETASGKYDRVTGKAFTKQTTGWLSLDLAHLEPLRTKRAEVATEREAHERAEQERVARPTHQLACKIVNSVEPEKSIEALELLGETTLRQIVDWLNTGQPLQHNFHIQRQPNRAGLLRGPNMLTKMCRNCLEDKTHGFYLYDSGKQSGQNVALFICDDCLEQARQSAK